MAQTQGTFLRYTESAKFRLAEGGQGLLFLDDCWFLELNGRSCLDRDQMICQWTDHLPVDRCLPVDRSSASGQMSASEFRLGADETASLGSPPFFLEAWGPEMSRNVFRLYALRQSHGMREIGPGHVTWVVWSRGCNCHGRSGAKRNAP